MYERVSTQWGLLLLTAPFATLELRGQVTPGEESALEEGTRRCKVLRASAVQEKEIVYLTIASY